MSKAEAKFGSPYGSSMNAALEHYHAVCSLNKHGVIAHTGALAKQILASDRSLDEWQALDIARAQVRAVRQAVDGQRLHRQARDALDGVQAEGQRGTGGPRAGWNPST
jgi:hypothetical protein